MFGLAWAAARYGNDAIADRIAQGFHEWHGNVCVLIGGYW